MIGTIINHYRQHIAQKSIEEVVNYLGVTKHYIIGVENNKFLPSKELLVKICDYIGIPYEVYDIWIKELYT